MVVSRVSSAGIFQSTISDALKVQSNLANLQNQVSSGLKANNFQGLVGSVETFVQMEAKMRKTETYIETNTLVISRLKTMEVALDQVIDIADSFKNLLMIRNNAASGQNVQFATSARSLMESLGAQLNTTQEGRYLFGGTKTDVPPVASPIPGSSVSGVPDDGYYQGNNQNLVARVQENYDVAYGIRANDPALQKLVAAMNLGLEADVTGSSELLSQATTMASEAIDEVIALRARLQQNTVNIEEISERHTQLNLYWKGFTESISKTDLTAASIEIAMDQSVLQASFQAFSTITSLRLTDFIR